MRSSAVSRLSLAALVLLSGCGGSSPRKEEPGPPQVREHLPPFQPRPVQISVVPRRGHVLTTFRIHIRSRAVVAAQSHVIRSYEGRLMRRPLLAGCITDTGPVFPAADHRPAVIVLDPRQQKGGRWCRGHFSGTLSYYRNYLCPSRGTCRPPKNFPSRHRRVARLAFDVR